MDGLGPAWATQGAGGEGALAGGQALVPARYVLRGLSCHMPVPVPAVELQSGWLHRVLAVPVREEEAGLGWPGACPRLPPAMPAGAPASTPLMFDHPPHPPCPPPESPSPLVRTLPIPLSHLKLHLLRDAVRDLAWSDPRAPLSSSWRHLQALFWLVDVCPCVPRFSPADPMRARASTCVVWESAWALHPLIGHLLYASPEALWFA